MQRHMFYSSATVVCKAKLARHGPTGRRGRGLVLVRAETPAAACGGPLAFTRALPRTEPRPAPPRAPLAMLVGVSRAALRLAARQAAPCTACAPANMCWHSCARSAKASCA
eukprot:scaffold213720_cov40-Tisochrysis_lutea.AAC.1